MRNVEGTIDNYSNFIDFIEKIRAYVYFITIASCYRATFRDRISFKITR